MAGGFTPSEAERPAKPLVVLYAADLAAAQRAVEQSGGKITRAIFAFPADATSTSPIPAATNWQCGPSNRYCFHSNVSTTLAAPCG